VRTGGLGGDLGSIGPGEDKKVKASEASGPDFTDVFIPWAYPSDAEGEGMELNVSGRVG
jgi:hypothetical protein